MGITRAQLAQNVAGGGVDKVGIADRFAEIMLHYQCFRFFVLQDAQVPGSVLRKRFTPLPGALRPLERAMDLGRVSARGADRVIRLSWTLADLGGIDRPGIDEVGYALGLWSGTPL